MPALSEALTSHLDSSGSPDQAVQTILNSPALIAETRQALPALHHAATAKAGQDGIQAVLKRRFATFPQPVRSDGEWAMWWADYYEALSDTPLASLEAAMRAWVAKPDSEFMPKPGHLRELAFTTPCRSLLRYQRAKRAIQFADTPAKIEGPPVDAAEVKALLAEYTAKAEARKPPPLPSIAGKTDERGITDEMRALLARQRA